MLLTDERRDTLDKCLALDVLRVHLKEKVKNHLGLGLPNCVGGNEEVITKVALFYGLVVYDGDVAKAGKHQVLQSLSAC